MVDKKEPEGPPRPEDYTIVVRAPAVGMVISKDIDYKNIASPSAYYLGSTFSNPEAAEREMKKAVRKYNEIFVVEGGTCECTKGSKEATIKATRVTETNFGKKRALTLSCTKMIEEDIFGTCKKLTKDHATKLGKSENDIPPVPCKGNYQPVSDKWKGSATTVNDNGEDTILETSTLRCKHGGKIVVLENGQGTGQVESLRRAWDQVLKGSYSKYDTLGGMVGEIVIGGVSVFGDIADARDVAHGIENKDGIEIVLAGLGFVPIFGGVIKKGGSGLRKIFRKKGVKVAEEVVESVGKIKIPDVEIKIRLSKRNQSHINKHNIESLKNQSQYLTESQLAEKLAGNSFFNPNWTSDDINKYTEIAYNDLLSQGKKGDTFLYSINGEEISIYINPDGSFGTAYGNYQYTIDQFKNFMK